MLRNGWHCVTEITTMRKQYQHYRLKFAGSPGKISIKTPINGTISPKNSSTKAPILALNTHK